MIVPLIRTRGQFVLELFASAGMDVLKKWHEVLLNGFGSRTLRRTRK